MAERTELIEDEDERAAAQAWLAWSEAYVEKRDPFTKPTREPKVKSPTYSDIEDFKKRLGFRSSLW